MYLKSIAIWAIVLLFGIPASAEAVPIAIKNSGFENPPTSSFIPGAITGWTIAGSGAGVWNINPVSGNPLGFWTTPAPEGNQIGFVAREIPTPGPASIAQVLSDTLQANSLYTLTGQVGHPIGFGMSANPDTVYTVELLAGNTILSTLSGTGPEGSFIPFQLTFNSTGSPFIGQALQIRLSSTQAQTGFDDIALNATPVPEPSTLCFIATGFLGLLGRGRPKYKRR